MSTDTTTQDEGLTARELETRRVLSRARALLAKAEATDFPEEAQALGARAYVMVAAHGIDVALLTAGKEGADADPIESLRLPQTAPYARDKMILVNYVAMALGCHALQLLMENGTHVSELHGYRSDLQRAQMMALAVLAQAELELARETVPDYTTPKRFRRSWLKHYMNTIYLRLVAAEAAARKDATAAGRTAADGTSLELVLVSRAERLLAAYKAKLVEDAVGAVRPSRVGDVARDAGQAAALRTDLGGRSLPA